MPLFKRMTPHEAMMAGKPRTAFSLYRRRLERMRDQPHALAQYLLLAANLGQDEAVRSILPLLESADEYRMVTLGQKLRLMIESGMSASVAIDAVSGALRPGEAEAIAAALNDFPFDRPLRHARHIAILGISFCGSTLIDRLLGSLGGVASIGESHWLAEGWDGAPLGELDIAAIEPAKAAMCVRCGPHCPYLTPAFRTGLTLNPSLWYDQIATRLETDILVSADKNLPLYLRYAPAFDFTALVLFKSPLQAWLSARSKLPAGLDAEARRAECDALIDQWTQSYGRLAGPFRPQGGCVYFDFDGFVRHPERDFALLLRALDLPADLGVLTGVEMGHAIGGNHSAMEAMSATDGPLRIVPRPDEDLPAEERAWVAERADAAHIHAKLRAASVNRA